MNTRQFLSRIATSTAGLIVAPHLFIPRATDRYHWATNGIRSLQVETQWFINPEWVKARFELSCIRMPTGESNLTMITDRRHVAIDRYRELEFHPIRFSQNPLTTPNAQAVEVWIKAHPSLKTSP